MEAINNGRVRVLCYSPAIDAIDGNNGVLLTFDVTTNGPVAGGIMVDDIEFVTTYTDGTRITTKIVQK